MKKLLLSALAVFAFAGHGDNIDDPGMTLLNENNYKGALEVFKKECKNGNGWACGNAGYLLYKGKNIKHDITLAKKYFNKGCDLKDIDSCINLGEIAYVEQNMVAAKGYFQKACGMKEYIKLAPKFVRALYVKDVESSCKKAAAIK